MKRHASMIVATLALAAALGGTAVAASHYLITSTSQISPKVLKRLHGARGPEGWEGAQGPMGPQGPAGGGVLSSLTFIEGPKEHVGPEEVAASVATCPGGQHVVSGGAVAITTYGTAGSFPSSDHTSWIAIALGSSPESSVTAYVGCAGAGQAVAASSGAHRRAVAQAQRMVAALERARG
jgi:hypothetical protein